MDKEQIDWMLVQIRGYNEEKGYIYATRFPDGTDITIGKKRAKGRSYFDSMTKKGTNTYTPPGSVVAVYGVEKNRPDREFYLAGWATPVSKDLSQEDVYVTPIKVSSTPLQTRPTSSGKAIMATANVLDQDPLPITEFSRFQQTCLDALNDNSDTSLPLGGGRGFMVRIGTLDETGKSSCVSFEFLGKPGNSPEQTWGFHRNKAPNPGRQKNLLQVVAAHAHSNLKHPDGFVEVVGFTRAIINDFGREENVKTALSLPNYKREDNGKTVDAYSMAAVVVSKQDPRRIIKAQHPLPKNKYVTHGAGVLGRHAGMDMPAVIKPISSKTAAAKRSSGPGAGAPSYPLQVTNNVNQSGDVRNFIVTGSKENLQQYKDRIFAAGRGVAPYPVRGGEAYAFPLELRSIVEASLHDLAGTPPFYLAPVVENRQSYVAIEGEVENPKFAAGIAEIEQRLDGINSGGKVLIPESRRADLISALNSFGTTPPQAPAQHPGATATDSERNASTPQPRKPKKISFGEWQQQRFGQDAFQMMDFLDGEIAAYAQNAGIDWAATRKNVFFGSGKKDIIKGSRVVPLTASHRGSVAVAATKSEKLGREVGDSIVYFSIRFWNKKILKDDTIAFSAYPYLKDAYDADIASGNLPKRNDDELDKIKEQTAAREAAALRRAQNEQEKDERSVAYWAASIPALQKETGEHPYWAKKSIPFILDVMDIRRGIDQRRGAFAIYSLYDINQNFVGAQRLYEKPFVNERGKSSDKDFIRGTSFDDQNEQPLGTHHVIGEIEYGKSRIHYAEGLATAASIYAATGEPVVICLNKGNLAKVIPLFHAKYPENTHICARDHDAFKPAKGNAGYLGALEACEGTNALIAGPDFTGFDISTKPTDFNDLHNIAGLHTVRTQLSAATAPPTEPLERARLVITLVGTEKLEATLQSLSKALSESSETDLTEAAAAEILYTEAIHHYGASSVMGAVSHDYLEGLGLGKAPESTPVLNETLHDISVIDHVGKTGKKSLLVQDHTGKLSEKIEDTLKYILNKDSLIYNQVLGGWIAPYGIKNIANSFLHEHTDSPQLYIGLSRKKYQDQQLLVIRGDFRDPEFMDTVKKRISFANPEFSAGEFGLVIPDRSHRQYIENALQSYLMPGYARPAQPSKPAQPVEVEKATEEPLSANRREAMALSGASIREIALAEAQYQNGVGNGAAIGTDVYYFALYAAALRNFPDGDGAQRRVNASREAVIRAALILDTPEKYHLSSDAKKSLEELVLHFEVAQELDVSPRQQIAADIIDLIAEKRLLSVDEVSAIVNGGHSALSNDQKTEIVQQYRELLVEDIAALEARSAQPAPAPAPAPAESTTPATPALETEHDLQRQQLEDQQDRVQELLLILRSAIQKGFDYEEFYDNFLTQPGSPYYSADSKEFDNAQLIVDLKFLSDPDSNIPGWDNAKIVSAPGLFAHEHRKIGTERLEAFEAFVIGFIERRGPLGFRTFSRHLTGEVELEGLHNPYLIDGELDDELLKNDLEYFTEQPSVNALFREIREPFLTAQTAEEEANDDTDPRTDAEKAAEPVEVHPFQGEHGSAVISGHLIGDTTLYQVKLNTVIDGQETTIWRDHSLHLVGLEAQANRWISTFTGANFAEAVPPHVMKAELTSVMIDADDIEDGKTLVLSEVSDDQHEFYLVEETLPVGNGHVTAVIAASPNFNVARDIYREAEGLRSVAPEPINNAEAGPEATTPEAAIHSESPKGQSAPTKLRTLFNRLATEGADWSEVKQALRRELNVEFTAVTESPVKAQYDALVEKINAPSAEEIASQRYRDLYSETVALATNELIYDDYLEEFFKPDGMLVNRNPYFDADTGAIDRSTAMADLRGAGYNSLAHFYEGVFKSIHSRASSEFVVGRVGGYIPESIVTGAPLRPQFSSLAGIFDKTGLGEGQTPKFLPPYGEWISSPDALRIAHPIFAEDLSSLDPQDLVAKYSHDELLMLADVHGSGVSAADSPEDIAEKTVKMWNLRQGVAEIGVNALRDMEPDEVVTLLEEFSLSTSGAHEDRSRRLAGYVNTLQSLSQVRIAQYSYIQAALQNQALTGRLPGYVTSAISGFINSENTFLDAADQAIADIRRARNRIDIDRVMSVVGADNNAIRATLEVTDYSIGQIVGIDSRKKLALTFSDKQLEDNKKLGRYTHTYALPDGVDVKDVLLPSEITHYAIFQNNVIGTATAINNDHLLAHNFIPLSSSAVVSACSPLSHWLKDQNYLAFEDSFGNQQFALKEQNSWQTFVIRNGEIEALRGYRNEKELIKAVATSISEFNDRDVLVEAFIDQCRRDYREALDKLADFTGNQLNPVSIADIETEINNPVYDDILSSYREEDTEVQVTLLIRGLERQIRQQAWDEISASSSDTAVAESVDLEAIDRLHALARFTPADGIASSPIEQGEAPVETVALETTEGNAHSTMLGITPTPAPAMSSSTPEDDEPFETASVTGIPSAQLTAAELEDALPLDLSGREFRDIAAQVDVLETVEKQEDSAVFLFPDGSYQVRNYTEVVETEVLATTEQAVMAEAVAEMSTAEKHDHAQELAIGQTLDMFAFDDEPELDTPDATIDSTQYDDISVATTIDPQTGEIEVGEIEVFYDDVFVNGVDFSDRDAAPTFEEFSATSTALEAHQSFLNNDPRTAEGMDAIARLPGDKVNVLAKILGLPIEDEKPDTVELIRKFGVAIHAAQLVASNPEQTLALDDEQKLALSVTTGIDVTGEGGDVAITNWLNRHAEKSQYRLALHNYNYLYGNGATVAVSGNQIRVGGDDDILPITAAHMTPEVFKQLPTIAEIETAYKDKDHNAHTESVAAISQIGVTTHEFTRLAEQLRGIDDKDSDVTVVNAGGQLQFNTAYGEFQSLAEAVDGIAYATPVLRQGDAVVGLVDGKLHYGEVQDDAYLGDKVSFLYQYEHRLELSAELDINDIATAVDEEKVENTIETFLRGHQCPAPELSESIIAYYNGTNPDTRPVIEAVVREAAGRFENECRDLDAYVEPSHTLYWYLGEYALANNAGPIDERGSYADMLDKLSSKALAKNEVHDGNDAEFLGIDTSAPYADPVASEDRGPDSQTPMDALPGSGPNGDGGNGELDSGGVHAEPPRAANVPGEAEPGAPVSSASQGYRPEGTVAGTGNRRFRLSPEHDQQFADSTAAARAELSIQALALRNEINSTGREVTEDDRQALSLYTGFAGYTSIFRADQNWGTPGTLRRELLKHVSSEEYANIRSTVNTAYYTPSSIIQGAWEAARHLGFQGGKVLDPSTGIGHFIGAAPDDIAEKTKFIAREIDPVSTDIAQMIYGKDVVKNEAFEKTRFPAEYFDLAISNIPFGDIHVNDPDYNRHKLMIHDYFVLKALEKVKPGGLVTFITSTGTMDKANSAARELMLDKADLLGAIRLPNNAFSSSAGTSVSSDMLFFRKREPGLDPQFDTKWVTPSGTSRTYTKDEWESELNNHYFASNPDMIIGEIREVNGRFGPELQYIHEGDSTVLEEIQKRIAMLPENVIGAKPSTPEIQGSHSLDIDQSLLTDLRMGCYIYTDGKFGILSEKWNDTTESYEATVEPAKIPATRHAILRDYIELRDITRETIAIQSDEHHQSDLAELQRRLGESYDKFVETHGHIQIPKTKKILSIDPDFPVVAALELPADMNGQIARSDIFYDRVIKNTPEPTSVDNADDGVLASLSKFGRIEPSYIESLTSRTWSDLREELGNTVFKNPRTSKWEPSEQYLSGHIRNKLWEATAAVEFDPEYSRNVTALKDAMPAPIPPYDIKARLGSTWVPTEVISEFMAHILIGEDKDYNLRHFECAQAGGLWRVAVNGTALWEGQDNNEAVWGTARVPFVSLMEKILNSRQIKVTDNYDGKSVVNSDETLAANDKAESIKAEFKDWLWRDPTRSETLAKLYNEQINVFVEPKYSAKGLSLNGMATHLGGKPLKPYDTQLASIRRYLVEGRALFAHPVGAGKTLELVASAIIGKQLGAHSKPLVVVPNNVLSQFGNMAREMFPNSKVLVATKRDLEKSQRQAFTARIATSNWDMVVVPMSVFGKISTPLENQRRVIQDEKMALRESLDRLSGQDNSAASMTIKRVEKKLDKLEADIEKLKDGKIPDGHMDLKAMGVDALFVDEADNFLNLTTATQMSHIPGVNSSASEQAMSMLMAVRYIQDLNEDYRGVVFATGTDVRNSMSDMYTMLRYLGPDILESAGVSSFDEFMGAFGEVVTAIEINPEGTGYRQNSRLSRFVNVPEMAMMYRQIADVLVPEQLNLKKPKIEEIKVVAEPCQWLEMYMTKLSERAQACRGGGVDPSIDNILKISHNGKQASLDMRLIDPRIPDNPTGKIGLCVDNVAEEYQAGNDKKLVQVIFCDQGTPGGGAGINLYEDIREKLVNKGIPREEIVFAHEFNTDARKDDMQAKLNAGIYRIAIGSTEKLGVGNNFQQRLVAEHDLDPPWRPRDVEQRRGRMDRTGNTNPVARLYTYSTKDSFDLFMWETLKRKASFIHQTKVSPRDAARVIDEDVTPNYSEIMAITTGNPLIREKMDIDSQIEKLEANERIHRRQSWIRESEIRELTSRVNAHTGRKDSLTKILPITADSPLVIGTTECTDHKKGGALLKAIFAEFEQRGYAATHDKLKIGEIGGITIDAHYLAHQKRWVACIHDEQRQFTLSDNKIPSQMVYDLLQTPVILREELDSTTRRLEKYNLSLSSLEAGSTSEFPHTEQLKSLRTRSSEIELAIAEMAQDDQTSRRHQGDFVEELGKLRARTSNSPSM